jgi:hypothetical protein
MNHVARKFPVKKINDWKQGEPALADVMNDPIVQAVMARDGLSPESVWPVLRAAQQRQRGCLCPAALMAA